MWFKVTKGSEKMKAADYIDNKTLFVLGKGDPGSGKSIAVSTWLEKGPMYFIDFDGKIKAIINFWKKHKPSMLDNLEFDHFETYNEAMDKFEDLYKSGGCTKYTGGICIDTLTTGVDSLLVQVNDIKGGGNKKVGGIAVNEIEDYNAESSGLTRLISHAKFKLHKPYNINFFLLAHVVMTESIDLKTKNVIQSRQLVTAGKKVAAKLPGYFDEIWHFGCEKNMETSAVDYKVMTQNAGVDYARTSCNLPASMTITYPRCKTLYQQVKLELDTTPLK